MERTVTFVVDENKLEDLGTNFETELGWLEESGIVVKVVEEKNK